MMDDYLYTTSITICAVAIVIFIAQRVRLLLLPRVTIKDEFPRPEKVSQDTIRLRKRLQTALPECIVLPDDSASFQNSMNWYWAQQECEVVPACFVRPRHVQDLSTAVQLLKQDYDDRSRNGNGLSSDGLFAIRGGGHSPVPHSASINGGILIDLSLFNEVIPSEDGSTVAIGGGAKWKNVSKILDTRGLAVVAGRNSDVGVGGSTLGGGLSFFSPRLGLVCSNIVNYKVVLASGTVVIASETHNKDLWRALKGGTNNFGIVTQFTARAFPCQKVWSGFLYMLSSSADKALVAFHEFVEREHTTTTPNVMYDAYAGPPITCFSYIHALGIQAFSVNLMHTKAAENNTAWPS